MGEENGEPLHPLEAASASFVTDPALADTVEVEREHPEMHEPTSGPNRLTVHVPTETTRLSLGAASPAAQWNTDVGITGHTLSHIHFETKATDKTVISLGGSATTSDTAGLGGVPPKQSVGYAMVTDQNAWHEAAKQHYLLSQQADISLRTAGSSKRAVVQADAGKVDVNAGQQINVSGGGVSITAARLSVEDVGYGESWQGQRPHESPNTGKRVMLAIASGLAGIANVVHNTARSKHAPGELAATPATWKDKGLRALGQSAFVADAWKVYSLVSTPESPPKCVRMVGEEKLAAMAGGDISAFGVISAGLGSGVWTTFSGAAASLKGLGLAAVGAAFASMKGYAKFEAGSDHGDVFVGAKSEVHIEGKKNAVAGADLVAHVASSEGHVLCGAEKVWFATKAGWGMLFEDDKVVLGETSKAGAMEAAAVDKPNQITVSETAIKVAVNQYNDMTLDDSQCQIRAKNGYIRFKASSGPVTVNGKSKILLK